MNENSKYWDIYNNRVKEVFNKSETTAVNNPGTARAAFVLIPYIATISLFEFLWKRCFS